MNNFFLFQLPYAEYWLPLLIGMLVGLGAIGVSKLVFNRKPAPAAPIRNTGGLAVQANPEEMFVNYSNSEQRQTLRREGNPTEIYIAPPDRKDRPSRGWIVDRSLGGLLLSVSEEHQPGSILSILPVNAPEMTHWVDIEIKSCRPSSGGWDAGCCFVKSPPFSIQMMFG